MTSLAQSYRPETTPKAKQQWIQIHTGAIYTVISNKVAFKPGKMGARFMEVTAFTTDAAVLVDGEGSNGKLGGEKVHFVWMDEWKFSNEFAQV